MDNNKLSELLAQAEKLLSEKNWEDLLSVSSEAIKLAPKNDLVYVYCGIAKGELGDIQGAINDCDKALKINPENDRAYVNRGAAKGESGDIQGAINDCDKALKINPKNSNAYVIRGIAKRELDRFNEAIIDFDRALDINPDNTQALFNKNIVLEYINPTHTDYYLSEKNKLENQFEYYNNKKIEQMRLLISIVQILVCFLLAYLCYLVFYKNSEWSPLSFFPALAIVSLSLFPLIWSIRNTEHDRSRYWAMKEDMHTKWIFAVSIERTDLLNERRTKLLLHFLEHLNNSNTPNIILSKNVSGKNDFNSMAKNFIHQTDDE